ncbi:MAG: N-6 DNA methylase [Sandaracinaceae bacterium]|nr:N-6 DNA methylase [Sandaracinaceae bacterium]
MATDPALRLHINWLGYVQPIGLVVSPPALVNAQCALPIDLAARQATFLSLTPDGRIGDLATLLGALLDWQATDLVPAEGLDALEVVLPDYRDMLRPTFAVPKGDEDGWQMLVVRVPADTDLDATPEDATPGRAGNGWRASPQARIERLLREKEIPVGLLVNDTRLRLVYAPRGESSGHLTFRLSEMRTVAGRPILGALCMLLGAERLFQVPPNKRLPNVLKESRKYQNEVSTRLAEQVLGALDELVRGFELADADRGGDLLRHAITDDPQHVYGGLITVLLRLVFLLYAEERALTPGDAVYTRHYSVSGLFDKLRADAGRFPDTMDQRFGAWAQLVSLFRLVHDGGGDGTLYLPARRGTLFDPERYPFLEGRPYRQATSEVAPVHVPRVPDGVLWRVLEKLLMLDAERLSYRALDVEQIGSVYEAMMGFELRRAFAPSLALKPKRVVVSLQRVLDAKDRARVLSEEASCELTGKAAEALKAARTVEQIAAAIDKKAVDKRIIPEGGLYLQPGEERRRSGSHYTPRSLTEPIVRTTLRPVLEGLGPRPTPTQLLNLKVCDPAMGSGAFLVEACRQLGDALVESWSVHRETPPIPADEDPVLHARRLVAQRCLYGVDKNPFAVNLAKLSLWLVTLAKDHAFTFLDHALKHGDSLVGLTKRQIGRFDWQADDAELPPLLAWIEGATGAARGHRAEIQAASDDEDSQQRARWRDAEDAVEPARVVGDLCIAAFFSADKDKAREERRRELRELVGRWRAGDAQAAVEIGVIRDGLRRGERPVVPFHWEVEFPEVFDRGNGGFDCVVGNPPFWGNSDLHRRWRCVPRLASLRESQVRQPNGLGRLLPPTGQSRPAESRMASASSRPIPSRLVTPEPGTRRVVRRWGNDLRRDQARAWPGAAAVVVSVVHVGREAQDMCVLDGHQAAANLGVPLSRRAR